MTTPMEHAHAALKEGPLDQLAKAIYRINRDNGWFDPDAAQRSVNDELMLIVGEVAEAHEEDRAGHDMTERYYTYVFSAPHDRASRAAQDYLELCRLEDRPVDHSRIPIRFKKPEGIPSELADIIIRVLDVAYRYGIDLEEVLLEKLAFNETRGYRHGGKKI
jgi:NTP pyrophosphatase (non-canonical NTP hydrolase)